MSSIFFHSRNSSPSNKSRNDSVFSPSQKFKADFYFEALVRGEISSIDRLAGKRDAIFNATRSSLKPYRDFIKNSIEAERKKTDYECNFKILKSHDTYTVNWVYPRYSILKTQITPELYLNIEGIELKKEKNRIIFETSDIMVTFTKDDVELSKEDKKFITIRNAPKWNETIKNFNPNETITLNNNSIKYKYSNTNITKGTKIFQNGNAYTIRSIIKENEASIDFELEPQQPFISTKESIAIGNKSFFITPIKPKPEKLFYTSNNKPWDFQKEDDEYFSDENPISTDVKDENGIVYKLKPYNNSKKGRNRAIIQLLDDANIEEGEKSSSDYFVENEMLKEVYQDNKANAFKVLKIKTDDHQLYVEKVSKTGNQLNSNFPIKMVVDLNNLYRQRDAIKALSETPVRGHRNLIRLFEDKERCSWPTSNPHKVDEWFVLDKPPYQGKATEAQRSFVEKALGANDFMLLEGPPGSGKTTAILELILQFVKEGKRILLTASTHVAIDNILERIRDYPEVTPLRIGRESSIGESVKEFLIDNKVEELIEKGFEEECAERFLLDSSNLVCGTTMGIQNHPDFRRNQDDAKITQPIYDVMIIDEASKTTFQEFLVPALFAKKWIIIGDIQQLSPYTENEYLKSHLTRCIDEKTQSLCALMDTLDSLKNQSKKGFANPECNLYPLAIELPLNCTIKDFKNYYTEKFKYIPSKIAYIKHKTPFDYDSDKEISWLDLYLKELVIIEPGLLKNIINYIPETFYIVSLQTANYSNEAFSRRKSLLDGHERSGRIQNLKDLNRSISQPWVERVSWRLVRKFERRNLKESFYEKSLEKLIPEKDEKTRNTIDEVEHIFFPSILELLQKGNQESQKYKTTLTSGFKNGFLESTFSQRFERLDYQHRMHPDISKFSREHFYGATRGVAELKDGEEINREWRFNRYPSRAVWIDVRRDPKIEQKNEKVNKNFTERNVIRDELDHFIQWAKIPDNMPDNKKVGWTVAILSYYRPQEGILRDMLQKYTNQPNNFSHFKKDNVEIQLYTVDKFQGREADVVFISMCRNRGIGFMDNTNRMNVALTRAKYQRVIVGDKNLFARQPHSEELQDLAKSSTPFSLSR
jgi:Superfamily I DNA and RNA helicases and helicase subunits